MAVHLRVLPHTTRVADVCEVWFDDQFAATVVGVEGGVRVISNHPMRVSGVEPAHGRIPGVVEITIRPGAEHTKETT